jgi:hypothetical protein
MLEFFSPDIAALSAVHPEECLKKPGKEEARSGSLKSMSAPKMREATPS